MSEQELRRSSLTTRIAHVLLPKKSKIRLSKADPDSSLSSSTNHLARLTQCDAICSITNDDMNEQTGERRDDTALLHGLSHYDSDESLDDLTIIARMEERRPPGEVDIAKLSSALWKLITQYLSLSDVICLAYSSKILLSRIDNKHWEDLRSHQHREEKIKFLMNIDKELPDHLLCFSCAKYHRRTKIGNENLRSAMVLNPIYNCNAFRRFGRQESKTRLTPGYFLPFSFVQLVTRAQKYTLRYGIPVIDLCRRYKGRDSDWFHQTNYYIHKGHLLLRVISQSYAAYGLPASGQRHLLYSRGDYWPYFSCCTHWRDGELLEICKCALTHIVEPPSMYQKGPRPLIRRPQNSSLVGKLCSFCRPIRRCPNCPTEYMIELKLSEDKADPVDRFKQSIVVTRWSDLGDGTSPFSTEWAAINEETGYDSFANLGKRAISGTFEAQFGVTLPGQRLISTNPNNEKRGEEGNKWY